MNEWVNDSASTKRILAFLHQINGTKPFGDDSFDFDLTRLNWRNYAMNLGYGIKCFVLKEEAALPSIGYNDVVIRMSSNTPFRSVTPWGIQGRPIQIRSKDEMKKIILSKESVKLAIAQLVK